MWLFSFILYVFVVGRVKSTVDYLQHPVKSCHVGDVVENECNTCLCTSKAVFECRHLNCSSLSSHMELEETEPHCFPYQLYVQNLIICICTKDGRWPHKSCHDKFQSLPPKKVITYKCEPNSYIPIDCNVCRCGPDGDILNERCTRNACDGEVHRRSISTNTVYSTCEEKYWYSLAPCQFCFCANQNKLVCNTGNYYSNNLDLGSYKLNICGQDLIKEAIELIPDNFKTLRMRPDVNITSEETEKRKQPLTESTLNTPEKHVMEISLNPVNKSKNITSNENYYDESEKKQHELIPTTDTTFRSTQIPSEDTDATVESEDITLENLKHNVIEDIVVNTLEDDDEESSESSVEIPIQYDEKPTTKRALRIHTNKNIMKEKLFDGRTLNIDVPKAFKKVFKLALRKSMISLSNTMSCTPGATTVNACNMCFCLKNGKLLCTTAKCSKKNKS